MSFNRQQEQIEKVFQTALAMNEAERAIFLEETCPDAFIRGEVEKLLTGEMEAKGETTEERELGAMVGRLIGVYRLTREIGRGGMGAVYLAERADGAFSRNVAVKLIKRGMDTDLVVRRFRNERQILATLSHPFITRLIDGGTTDEGLPYFVMEYIEGEPLYDYCDRRKLSVAERLKIFQKICGAVEEAHRYKIIHRDLKPSNVLVKADGTPKLLDFGIAKLLDPEFGVTAMEPTATHLRMMTPQYASPEQISGEAVTPASDIYSLGVLLYELLTGHRPYRTKSRSPFEIARAVREEEPERPSEILTREDNFARSEVFTGEKPTLKTIFEARGEATFEVLREQISGDLDKIVLQALRKNPAERYQSAFDLNEDIESYLENRPVKARAFDALPAAENVSKTSYSAVRGAAAAESSAKNSIAILPFKLLDSSAQSEETGDEYLTIGLPDALISRLSGVKRLTVRPTSSILRYTNEETEPFAAGRELEVEFIVNGNIRRTGERIRVSVQLLSIADNALRWSENFDESMTDVLEIEDSISERIVKTLVSHLSGEEKNQLAKRATDNPEAYEAYLRGRYHWNQFTLEGFTKALAFYRRAVELSPDYALPYAGIADYYNLLGVYAVRPFAETTAATREAAEKALALDPHLSEAHAAIGFAAQMGGFDWTAAENHFQKAIELNPNYSIARVWYAYLLSMMGRSEEAFAQIYQALELDSATPIVPQTLNWILYHARRFDEAIAATHRLIEKEPRYGLSYLFLSGVLWRVRRFDEALEIAHKAIGLLGRSGYTLCWLASAYAAAGQETESRSLIAEIENLASGGQYVSPYLLAMAYANLAEREKTFELLNKALEIGDGRLSWLAVDPQFDAFAGDARYAGLLKQIDHPSFKKQETTGGSVEKIRTATTPTSTAEREKSIAVLPLKLIGARNPDDEYLGIGLTDALITRLSNVRRFVMRPTSSVLKYASAESANQIDPFAAGRDLSVDFVLDGSIRRSGERLRVTVQLLSVAKNTTVWAESFDEKSSDVLELEDSISEKVARSLIPRLTGEEERRLEKRGTSNAEAYEEHLRGRYFWNQFTNEAMPKALASFQKAVALDPQYALAYADLADFYNWAGIFGIVPSQAAYQEAKRAAARAVEIDDTLSEAFASLGFVTAFAEFEWDAGEHLLARAVELNPNNSLAQEWHSTTMMAKGHISEGVEEIKLAEKLNPFSPRAVTLTAWTFYQARLFDETIAKARQLIDMDAKFWQGYLQLGNAYIHIGRTAEAVGLLRRALELVPESGITLYKLSFALAAENRLDEAREILQQLLKASETRYVKPYFIAMTYVAVGDHDKALEYFEKAFDDRDGWLLWLRTEPKLDVLRGDARFKDLLRKLNLDSLNK